MRVLYYDCFAGISGDMNIGAMIDLGVDLKYLNKELSKLNIDGFHLNIEKTLRRGISGTLATVVVENPKNEKHRNLGDIQKIINGSSLSIQVKERALKTFQLIAEAEAKVHNIEIQKVHFHEVGSLDSIVDIVGAAICMDYLKVDKVLSSPVQLGGGTVKCAHGIMPVPAPATVLILRGVPVKKGLVEHEATTPTGAAILVATVDKFTENFSSPISKIAYGIGQRDISEVPNILRLYLSETTEKVNDVFLEENMVLECNIDDMNPERFEYLLDKLFEAGANDAWLTPIIMKKMRPATMISVLCEYYDAEIMKGIIFQHSTTLGIREKSIQKNSLRRKEKVIPTEYGNVRIKECFYKGKRLRLKPEYEDCKVLAGKHNVTIAEIEQAVIKNS